MRGNPVASMRYRAQTYTVSTDEPLESEWHQLFTDAVSDSKRRLRRHVEKFGDRDICIKIFNDMNTKKDPMVITVDQSFVTR